jgi:hypothetical protein
MNTVAVAMDRAIARSQEVKQGYEASIVKEEAHIQLCQGYLDGERGDHPFDDASLRDEIARGWKTIALIQGEITKHAESVEALRKKLDEAIREPVKMVINLTNRHEGGINYEFGVQSRDKDRDRTDH